MNEALPPELPAGVAGALGTLRHALADPLSAAGVKLELLERRLAAAPPEALSLAERVRGVKADLSAAGRLIDLLPRLAGIAGELAGETLLGDLCRVAGIPLEGDSADRPRLRLRRVATTDALRSLVGFLRSRDPEGGSPRLHEDSSSGRVALRIEALGGSGEANPERLFHLPRGQERAEDLFLARVCIESDGGCLQLVEREGRLVALLSWPGLATAGEGGADL
ncbi:MAG TPA: hypothetical protein VE129_07700 [Thermoanaerobaculia bacterium]|nr:hypothetical protein [Thermoanaerobaculia bacterium]